MQTALTDTLRATTAGQEAEAILRSCVHCGFCTATCPTYLVLGDELDGPRGRIYLMKRVLEGAAPTAATQAHLDRCLTCRACETACPSGVRYGELLATGRELVDAAVRRPLRVRAGRAFLRAFLTGPLFAPLYRVGQWCRAALPGTLRGRLLVRRRPLPWPTQARARRVVLPRGCVQPAMAPQIDAAAARVLDRLGIAVVRPAAAARCCGAIRHHLGDSAGARAEARRNIEAWWPELEAGAEAIVSTASGCGLMIKEYGALLRDDAEFADRAARVSALTRDVSEVVDAAGGTLASHVTSRPGERVAVQAPCTLQHGQRLPGILERLLGSAGATLTAVGDSHLCCGSAGTYSVLEPKLATELRARKLTRLEADRPDVILSANVGCIAHLSAGTATRVQHWIEWLDERLH